MRPRTSLREQNGCTTAAFKQCFLKVKPGLVRLHCLTLRVKQWHTEEVVAWFAVRIAVRATREATVLTTFLGKAFPGIVNCDRAKMYWQLGCLQWCWAHLNRDFQAMVDSGTVQGKWLGSRLRRLTCALVEHWADDRVGKISWAALRRRMVPVRRKVERLLLRGSQGDHPDVCGTCREPYEHRPWLCTFLRHEGVEPSNKAGERSLRHAVVWRKRSFGPRSASGSRFVETMLTAIETCRQQRRNVFAYSEHCCRSPSGPPTCPFIAPRPLNGYVSFET